MPEGRKPPCWGLPGRPLPASPGPLTLQTVRTGSRSTALKRLMSICLRMVICLGDVSGSREAGSGESGRGCGLPGGDPLLGCSAPAPGQGGRALEAAAACVGGRASGRPGTRRMDLEASLLPTGPNASNTSNGPDNLTLAGE